MKIGITGGIGTGKSYVCSRLSLRGITVYDCDAAAKCLIRTSPVIQEQLSALIGPDTYIDGRLNKARVSQFLLQDANSQQAVNAIVHPAVFQDFIDSGMQWMESAILFESGISSLVDYVVVVTAPLEVRIQRVMARDGISRDKVLQWIDRQWPQEEVRRRADFEILNDGLADIDAQVALLLQKV